MKVEESPLFEVTSELDLRPQVLPAERGGLLVTVRGGRILGIYLDGEAQNLLWTHPALDKLDDARAFLAAGEWNLGGDRCWIAPELELHFKDPLHPSHENYAVPPNIDPGRYEIRDEANTAIKLHARGDAMNGVSEQPFQFETTRAISLCRPPVDVIGLDYVGYQLSSELRFSAVDRMEACYGLWQLAQLPPGGTIHIPVRRAPEIVDYFQTDVAGHCRVAERQVAFPVTGTAQHKLGLRSTDVTGAMAYLRPTERGATLIVRQATVFPGAIYADYPAHQPDRRDIAMQFYNDAGAIGAFGEMEYHSVAATQDNFFVVRDLSRTWCFGGPIDRLREVARELLGVEVLG